MEITYGQECLRKLVHLSSLWMVAAIYFLSKSQALWIFGILFAGNILIEYGYFKGWAFCGLVYGKFFGKMLRSKETNGRFHLSGAPYVLAAAFVSRFLFSKEIAMISLAVMLIGDTAAALVGRKFGKHKINNGSKSIEGALAFFIFSAAVLWGFKLFFLLPIHVFWVGLIGIFMAMIAEIYEKQLRLDDNFSIPLCVGLALTVVL